MTDRLTHRRPRQSDGERGTPVRPPPDARRRFRRRLLLVVAAPVVGWLVVAAVVSAATSQWDDRSRGLAFAIGSVIVLAGAAALTYRRISRPAGELLGAAEQVATGDYEVDVVARGPRELRLLI